MPDGTMVVDVDGALVAHVDDGELVEVAGLVRRLNVDAPTSTSDARRR